MNQKALHHQTAQGRKLPVESLFLAVVLAVGLAGIFGMFFQPEKAPKPEWKQAHISVSSTYVQGE